MKRTPTKRAAPVHSVQATGQTSAKATRDRQALFLVVGIGASAGGIEALISFFDAMPADSAVTTDTAPNLPAVVSTRVIHAAPSAASTARVFKPATSSCQGSAGLEDLSTGGAVAEDAVARLGARPRDG